jgi:WD40 repeat protein
MHGVSRWQAAVQAAEQAENEGQRFTLEALGNRIRIAPKTLRKVLRRQVSVDRSTLELCFSAFQLQLEAQDVDYLESPVALVTNLPISAQLPHPLMAPAIDWGEAPDPHPFYGRETELAQLMQWIQQDRCRSITLLGLGGIGKTALASYLAHQVAPSFEAVLWRSLRHAPDFATLLRESVLFLSGNQTLDYTLPSLMEQLRTRRCLLILDNFESVLDAGDHAGHYCSGYEPYGDWLRTIAEAQHQSCLLLTSREKPAETTLVSEEHNKLLILTGSSAIAEGILTARNLHSDEAQRQTLGQLYDHNPLALKVVAASVHELFDGNVAQYLAQGFTVPKGLQWVLAEQFARLSELEKTISYWLAINRDWTSIDDLNADIFPVVRRSAILQALESLSWRSLIEHKGDRYTQQPVIMEYVLEQLLEHLWEELAGTRPLIPDASSTSASKNHVWPMLSRYPLAKTTVREYIRQRQKQWNLKPLGDRLHRHLQTPANVEHRLKIVLEQLKAVEQPTQQGYGIGNCITLLQAAGIDLAGYDFSQCPIWQTSLQTVSLRQTNFTNAHFHHARFATVFGIILSLDFSPDGAFLAASDSIGTIRIYRVSTAQLHCLCQGHTSRVMAVRWSPDGTRLASASMDRTVRLWNAQTGVTDTLLTGHDNIVMSVSWHPTAPLLATSSDDYTVRVWNTETGNLHQIWQGHTDSVWSVDWSPDGTRLASASVDKTVRLWHLDMDKCQILRGHTDSLWAVEWCPDGQTLVSAGEDQTIRIWDAATGKTRCILNGHQSWIWALRVSPDGRQVASGSRDRTLRLWDLSTGQPLKLLQGHIDGVSAICWHPQGHLLVSGGTDQAIRLWDSQSGHALISFQGQVPTVWSLAWQPTRSLPSRSTAPVLASGHDGHVCLWEGDTGRLKHRLQGHQLRVWQVAWSPEGQQLASCGDDGTIRLWKGETGQPLQVWSGHQGHRIWSVDWHPNGTLLASGGADAAIWLWDIVTGQCLKVWNAHQRDITTVQFSPDGQWLAAGGDGGEVQLWAVATGEPLAIWEGHGDRITRLRFSPCGRLLASASEDRTIRLWQVPSGQCDRILRGHENRVWSVDFSPDGRTLASGSTDRTVRLWSVASGGCEAVLNQHNSLIWAIRWHPDGQTLVTAGEDGCIHIWGLPDFAHLKTLTSDRLYEGMNLSGVTGLSRATLISLKQLGAIGQA